MPWSVFCGRKQVTTHALDGGGRVVRSETELWTVEDREMALALAAYEADLCSGCRQPLAETTNPDNEDRYKTGRALLCHRCVATEIAGKAYENHDHPGALLIPVELDTT
jgi:superfamily II helicase